MNDYILKEGKNKLIKSKVMKNSFWIIIGKVMQMGISFLVGVVTARYLGPSNYGIINTVASYTSLLLPLCKLGLAAVFVKKIVENPEREGEYLGSGIVIRIISSILCMLILIIVVSIIKPSDNIFKMVTVIYSFTLLFQSFDLFELWYQAKLSSKYDSMIGVIGYSVSSVYKVILLILKKNVMWFAFATVLDYLVIALIYMTYTVSKNKIKLKFSFKCSHYLLLAGKHFILANLMIMLYASMDKIMIQHFLGEKNVGLYSVAVTICTMWTFVLNAIINSMRPMIIDSYSNKEIYKERIIQLFSIVIWASIIVSAIFSVFSNFIIRVLYGSQYLGSINALRIVTWYTGFSYLGVARSVWTVCENKEKYEKYFAFSGMVANFILNWFLIKLLGIDGAALASLITQIIANFLVPLLIPQTRECAVYILKAFNLKYLFNLRYLNDNNKNTV